MGRLKFWESRTSKALALREYQKGTLHSRLRPQQTMYAKYIVTKLAINVCHCSTITTNIHPAPTPFCQSPTSNSMMRDRD